MAVLSPSDLADVDRCFGLVLTLQRDRAISAHDAKAHLMKFVEELNQQNPDAARNLWSALAAIGGDLDA